MPLTELEKLEALHADWERTGLTAHAEQVADAFPLVVKALRELLDENEKAHETIQMILEGDMLKPEAYEPWGEEESIYDACNRIVTTWGLP